MTKDQFILYIKHPELLDQDSISGLKEIIADYPFFAAARMLYLRNLLNINSYKFETELVKHALYIPDRRKLFKLLQKSISADKEFELLPFDTDAFKYFFDDKTTGNLTDLTFLEAAPFQLVEDENMQVLNTTKASNDLIDKFISENPTIKPTKLDKPKLTVKNKPHDSDLDSDLITGTLASIYVKQGLYDEALKAYEKLILKFPEKNTYFASQIEKINKLISNKL